MWEMQGNEYLEANFLQIMVEQKGPKGAWGSVVVKALRFQSDGPRIDSL
jgi:hypothetical protein